MEAVKTYNSGKVYGFEFKKNDVIRREIITELSDKVLELIGPSLGGASLGEISYSMPAGQLMLEKGGQVNWSRSARADGSVVVNLTIDLRFHRKG